VLQGAVRLAEPQEGQAEKALRCGEARLDTHNGGEQLGRPAGKPQRQVCPGEEKAAGHRIRRGLEVELEGMHRAGQVAQRLVGPPEVQKRLRVPVAPAHDLGKQDDRGPVVSLSARFQGPGEELVVVSDGRLLAPIIPPAEEGRAEQSRAGVATFRRILY